MVGRQKDLWVFISMMLVCDANVIIEYDRRSSGLFSAALDISDLLLSYSMISLALHNTLILIITHKYQHLQIRHFLLLLREPHLRVLQTRGCQGAGQQDELRDGAVQDRERGGGSGCRVAECWPRRATGKLIFRSFSVLSMCVLILTGPLRSIYLLLPSTLYHTFLFMHTTHASY